MKSVEFKFDQEDMRDGLAPGWRWRVVIDGKVVAEDVDGWFRVALSKAQGAYTEILLRTPAPDFR